jgi:predicted O-methyltransferase YrrM
VGSIDSTLQVLKDPKAISVLKRLHARARREMPKLILQGLPGMLRVMLGKKARWERMEGLVEDKCIPLEPYMGVFCYLLARAMGARRVVEYGTGFAVSTIYLALAVRDNGGGTVIGTEMVSHKAKAARENVAEAGLSKLVDIREGDARETLRSLETPVDFLLSDGFPPAALEVLKLVAPRMRAGSVVITDNIALFRADYAEYLAYLRDPSNGFTSGRLALKESMEMSVRNTDS